MQQADQHTGSKPIESSDAELMQQFREGNQPAYERLFKRYYPSLCFFLQKMGLDLFPAEEIVQDALHKAWDRRADFPELK